MKRLAWIFTACCMTGTALAQGGPGMMGPGMMGGPGMGPGMMMGGGYGFGPGMMMGGYASGMDLTPEQRNKILDIEQSLARRHWDAMGRMHQQGFRMNFFRDGKFDEPAARKHYEAMAAVQKEMFETWLQAHKQIDALLTPEQRQRMQRAYGR